MTRSQLRASAILTIGIVACGESGQPAPDASPAPPPANIVTIAGENGAEPGYVDGDARTARFSAPEGLVLDVSGANLYIADSGNHAIRRLELATMQVTTVAGVGTVHGSNDTMGTGGTRISARLHNPRNLVLDPTGSGLYFTDTGNYAIRHLDLVTLEVTTVFGAAKMAGTTDGVGTAARFASDGPFSPWPGGMVIDARAPGQPIMYVADSPNQTIRSLDLTTREVKTIAGQAGVLGSVNGAGRAATFNKPTGLAIDGFGKLFVAEANNIDIRQIDLATTEVTTVAGKAPADARHFCENISPVLPPECGSVDASLGIDARFRFLYGVSPDGTGGFLVVDSHNNLIRRFDMTSTEVTTVAGVQATLLDDIPHASVDTSDGVHGTFWHPTHAVAATPNVLYVADRSANCIRRVEIGVE